MELLINPENGTNQGSIFENVVKFAVLKSFVSFLDVWLEE